MIGDGANVLMKHQKRILQEHARFTRVTFAQEWAPTDRITSSKTHHKKINLQRQKSGSCFYCHRQFYSELQKLSGTTLNFENRKGEGIGLENIEIFHNRVHLAKKKRITSERKFPA